MDTDIIRDMEQCYLVIQTEQGVKLGYQQKMLLHNELEGLLRIECRQVDENCKCYYDISNKINLCDYWGGKAVSVEDIMTLFKGIIKIIQNTREYMLTSDNFILKPDYIFVEQAGGQLYLCYYEAFHTDVRLQMIGLVEYLMEVIDYKEEGVVTLTYRLYKELREESCNFQMIQSVLIQHNKEEKELESEQSDIQVAENIPVLVSEVKQEKKRQFKWESRECVFRVVLSLAYIVTIYISKFIFNENGGGVSLNRLLIAMTGLIGINVFIGYMYSHYHTNDYNEAMLADYEQGEDTIVLPREELYILKSLGHEKDMDITVFPFLVGANSKEADGIIQKEGISKQHVLFEKQGGDIYIKDLHSTNGTFINGELINPMERHLINDGDKITLANITFEFIKRS